MYRVTDLDLWSGSPFPELRDAFDSEPFWVLNYDQLEDGEWLATVECTEDEEPASAELEIRRFLGKVKDLDPVAKVQWGQCRKRVLDLAFDCGATRCYQHALPADLVELAASFGCSIAITLYPHEAGE